MRQANRERTTLAPIPLSSLFRDPFVRDAFRRAERDGGGCLVIPAGRPPRLGPGAAQRVPELAEPEGGR